MKKFKGVIRQWDGRWKAFFYSHNDRYHIAAKDEDYAELAAFELMLAVEAFVEKYPEEEVYYEPTRAQYKQYDEDLWIQEL